MKFLLQLLIWWNGQTLGTRLYTWRKGQLVGEDEDGNKFYQSKDGKKRWVIYVGEVEATKISAEWYGWLHHMFDNNPVNDPLPHKDWELPNQENQSGTPNAYRPKGSILAPKPADLGTDYEAWTPS